MQTRSIGIYLEMRFNKIQLRNPNIIPTPTKGMEIFGTIVEIIQNCLQRTVSHNIIPGGIVIAPHTEQFDGNGISQKIGVEFHGPFVLVGTGGEGGNLDFLQALLVLQLIHILMGNNVVRSIGAKNFFLHLQTDTGRIVGHSHAKEGLE